jgi:D-glycero-D-manno-heptose 1,7-bisphosphate phosphatase
VGKEQRASGVNWAVFLDRDGTIIHDRHYLSDPAGVELLPGAAEGLRRLRELGALLVVVSNQSGVSRGYFSGEDLDRVNARMGALLTEAGADVEAIYVCPHGPDDECDCRKPLPGLLVRAARDLSIDLSRSFMIGDRPRDAAAGIAAGVVAIVIGGASAPDAHSVSDWPAAAHFIEEWVGAEGRAHRPLSE